MAKANDAVWTQIDPSTLGEDIAQAYVDYKAAYTKMKNARVLFEAKMGNAAELPQGKRLVFGYNFGKLSVAIVDGERVEAKPQVKTQSLAQFLASQASAGRGH